MKLRIAVACAIGIVLIGVLAWPLAVPSEPFGAVFFGSMSWGGRVTLLALGFVAGFIGYFLAWPYGREIGILAVPAGLAIWALRSGSMANLLKQHPTLAQRQALFAGLQWEPLIWLAIVGAGFAGVLVGQKIRSGAKQGETGEKDGSKPNIYLNAAIAVVGSGLIAQFGIRILAQDVTIFDPQLGSVVAQPAVGQIAFAVFVSFGAAAFLVKKFLDAGYIWPTIAGAFVTAFGVSVYVRQDILEHLVGNWPAVFFSNAVVSVLPVQMVAFGTLGSIWGYWLAVRYSYWREHG